MRRAAAAVARGPVGTAGASVIDRALPRRPGVLTILTYHRVDEPSARPDLMPSLISATPAGFRGQMTLVARQFDPVSMQDVLASLDDPSRLPPRAVLVTFDDGYLDFAANAWPILREASIPATLFVATAFSADPTTPFWWDRLWAAVRAASGHPPIATPVGTLAVGPDAARATVARLRTWIKGLDHDEAMGEVDRIVGELAATGRRTRPRSSTWTRCDTWPPRASRSPRTRAITRSSTASPSNGRSRRSPCRTRTWSARSDRSLPSRVCSHIRVARTADRR